MDIDWVELLPDLWRLRIRSSSEYVDHVNAYLLKSNNGWTLVDTGFPGSSEALVRSLAEVTAGEGLLEVILTHIHYDHAGGSRHVSQTFGCTVSMHPDDIGLVEMTKRVLTGDHLFFRAIGIEGQLKETVRSFFARNVKLFPDTLKPIREGDVIGGPGGSWRVIHTPGHTPGHVCLYNDSLGALISGDHLLPRETSNVPYYPIPGYGPLRSYLKSLLRIESIKPTVVLPAHGEPFRDVESRVDYLFNHHESRLRETLESMSGSVDAIGLARRLKWSRGKFDDLGPVDHWLAILEALSHAEFLVELGLAERVGSDRMMYRALSKDFDRIGEELKRLRNPAPS